MPDFDLERFMNETYYAIDLQRMIGDIDNFLKFSESTIEWQYRRELQDIRTRAEFGEFSPEYKEHLETSAAHRFKASLPLRVRYAALIALITSVEWSMTFLVKRLKEPLCKTPKNCNETVHALKSLQRRTGVGSPELVDDYNALVQIRNCIAHSAGIKEHYKYREQLQSAVGSLKGFALDNWNFLGEQVCIEKGALTHYIQHFGEFIVALHKAAHEQCLLLDEPRIRPPRYSPNRP